VPATAAIAEDSGVCARAVGTARLSSIDGNLLKCRRIEQFLGAPLPSEDHQFGESEPHLLDRSALNDLLLEREPFFFIDRAVAVGDRIAFAVARMTTERSAGHFPGRPIVPLIELCKAMAQAGLILIALKGDQNEAPIAIGSGRSKAVAKGLIPAPVDILIKVTLETSRLKVHLVNGSTFVGTQKIGTLADILYTLVPKAGLLG